MNAAPSLAGIVLCGGDSTRMGRPKASLPFGATTMLQRVIGRLSAACNPIVVVAAADQPLPDLPADIAVARDERPQRGPLEGLIAGLEALAGLDRPPDAAYATSCDVPLLAPSWPRELAERLGDAQVAVPFDERFHHPLAAVYRLDVLGELRALSERDELRPRRLFDLVDTVRVPVDELRSCDPQLDTLRNLNTPDDYLAALAREGLECPAELRQAWNLTTSES